MAEPALHVDEEKMPPVWKQVRWGILGLLFLATVINFIDRQTLSIVAPVLRDTLHLSNQQYGYIVAAFMLGMMLGEFPMGMFMDRKGPRLGFTIAVFSWSVATGLHSLARSVAQFSVLRFWMGTSECGNFSGGMRVVSQWFPARERALAVGVFNGGSMIGSILALPLIAYITAHFGWRMSFLIASSVGFVWLFLWRLFYRSPADHPKLTRAEALYIAEGASTEDDPAPTNAQLLRLKETWGLMLCRFLGGPVVQFYLFWLPEYLYRERGLSLTSIGMFAWVPFLFGGAGSILGGWSSGFLMKCGVSLDASRKIVLVLGALCCLLSVAVVKAPTTFWAIFFVCLVLVGHTGFSANMFAAISDVFPNRGVGRVTGLTGIAGGLSGWLFPLLTGFLVDKFSYIPVFAMAALMPLAGALALFLLVGKIRRVEI
jgi:ACS family hexuronate transporter-like MFS transporter